MHLNRITRLFLFCFLFLASCSRLYENEVHFSGTIEEIHEDSMLVRVNEEENEYQSSDLILVSSKVEQTDNGIPFHLGDEIIVYYDGAMAESYPAQIHGVYRITLKINKKRKC